MSKTILRTDYKFPDQNAIYHGKVRDVYSIGKKYLIAVATDRISAFDVVLPRAIPYKGQVLNQLAAHFLQESKSIVPNWFIDSPDPNVTIGYKCAPFKIEMIVRSMLVGHAWREYKAGKRSISGVSMPDGMKEYEQFEEPIITPSTKAESGHDEDISADEIIKQGLATPEQFNQISDMALKLFQHGQNAAREKGLILSDTKYEFGLLGDDILVIDEIHTPDSSRYFYLDSYETYISDRQSDKPKNLSKEFVRVWLMERGFSGQKGQELPELTDDFISAVSDRYIELYECLTGKSFEPADNQDIISRIETSTLNQLKGLKT